MNFEIVVATNNKHKLKEIRSILSPHKITIYGLSDLNLKVNDIIENGQTYQENALIKAQAIAKLTTLPILSDDSGLEIKSLNNKPGIFSARYAESLGGHNNAINQILADLKDKNREARFVCDIVVLNIEDKPLIFEGIAEGTIGEQISGEGGFGYDPIFISKELNKSFALLSEEEKNLVSHRGKALKKFLTYLKINKLAL